MRPDRFEEFARLYRPALADARARFPEEYPWPAEDVPVVAEKMLAAVRRGSFNKDGRAFKIVCRQLGIRHTYRDIRAYLEGQ